MSKYSLIFLPKQHPVLRYKAQPIVQKLTKEGELHPKAPAGIAEPVGWLLTEDAHGNVGYIQDIQLS